MREEVKINFDEYWCKPDEEFQFHWALIEERENGECTVYFINTVPSQQEVEKVRQQIPQWHPPYHSETGIFDQMEFSNIEEAKAALRRNGIKPNSERTIDLEYGIPPKPPFYRINYQYGPGYTTGVLFWKDKDGSKRSTEISRAVEPKGCLVVLFLVITSLCFVGVGLFHVC
jgi:hypothetical protein